MSNRKNNDTGLNNVNTHENNDTNPSTTDVTDYTNVVSSSQQHRNMGGGPGGDPGEAPADSPAAPPAVEPPPNIKCYSVRGRGKYSRC